MIERKDKAALKEQQRVQEEMRLKNAELIMEGEDVTVDMMAAQLKDQLERYQSLMNGIPLKSHLKMKAQIIAALKEAITKLQKH